MTPVHAAPAIVRYQKARYHVESGENTKGGSATRRFAFPDSCAQWMLFGCKQGKSEVATAEAAAAAVAAAAGHRGVIHDPVHIFSQCKSMADQKQSVSWTPPPALMATCTHRIRQAGVGTRVSVLPPAVLPQQRPLEGLQRVGQHRDGTGGSRHAAPAVPTPADCKAGWPAAGALDGHFRAEGLGPAAGVVLQLWQAPRWPDRCDMRAAAERQTRLRNTNAICVNKITDIVSRDQQMHLLQDR